jgi:hypothetical protein
VPSALIPSCPDEFRGLATVLRVEYYGFKRTLKELRKGTETTNIKETRGRFFIVRRIKKINYFHPMCKFKVIILWGVAPRSVTETY